jgi:glycine/D-amino acid oxidase-like deaminating enzyme
MSLSPQRTDVLIIGGGVIGCSIAYFLSTQDVEVMVLEREEIAAEASSAAFGMISPLAGLGGPAFLTDLMLESWSLFAALIPALEAVSEVDIEYRQIGSLHVALEADEIEPLHKLLQAGQARDIEMQWLTGDEARKLAPQLSPQVLSAVYAPAVGSIQADAMTRAYAGAALGGTLLRADTGHRHHGSRSTRDGCAHRVGRDHTLQSPGHCSRRLVCALPAVARGDSACQPCERADPFAQAT